MPTTESVLNNIGQYVVDRLKDDIRNKSINPPYPPPNNTGKLANSIRYEVVGGGILRIYAEDYIYTLQYGRKPGKRPPTSALTNWVKTKLGVSDNKKAKGIAYVIARKIGEEGSSIYRKGGSDLISSIINAKLYEEIKDQLYYEMQHEMMYQFKELYQSIIFTK